YADLKRTNRMLIDIFGNVDDPRCGPLRCGDAHLHSSLEPALYFLVKSLIMRFLRVQPAPGGSVFGILTLGYKVACAKQKSDNGWARSTGRIRYLRCWIFSARAARSGRPTNLCRSSATPVPHCTGISRA